MGARIPFITDERSHELKRSLRTLFRTLFAAYLLALLATVGALVSFNHFENSHTAHLLAVSVRNDVVSGDLRDAIITLSQSVPMEFSAIFLFDGNGSTVFALPTDSAGNDLARSKAATLAVDRASEPVFLAPGEPPSGQMVFFFPRTRGLPIAIGIWLGFLALSIPFIRRARNRIVIQYDRDLETRKNTAMAEMASQLAHDIRSPLAALKMASRDLGPLSQETRTLVEAAVTRIGDIASLLLQRNPSSPVETAKGHTGTAPLLLPALLDSILSEKRLEYRNRTDLLIEAPLDAGAYGIFVHADAVETKRMLSNLINNSAEAIPKNGNRPSGTIQVSLKRQGGGVSLVITDNGAGIPENLLARLGERGLSFGKEGGSGLGLHHAMECMKAWGGVLEVQSEPGKGTRVALKFPLAEAPAWFVKELALERSATVAVADDDPSIHRIWKNRLGSDATNRNGVEVLCFSTPETFSQWIQQAPPGATTTYLIDYEFSGHSKSGLALIQEFGIARHSVLVTSRYEDSRLLEECGKLGVRLLPKSLASWVPIRLTPPPPRPS